MVVKESGVKIGESVLSMVVIGWQTDTYQIGTGKHLCLLVITGKNSQIHFEKDQVEMLQFLMV